MRMRKYIITGSVAALIMACMLFTNGCAVSDFVRDLLTANALESVPENEPSDNEPNDNEPEIIEQDIEEQNIEEAVTDDTNATDSRTDSAIEMEPPIIVVQESEQNPEDVYEDNSDAQLQQLKSEQSDKYAYSKLNESDKAVYVELYAIIRNMAHNVLITSLDTEQIDRAFKCVLLDHPEIFYLEGYSITKHTRAGVLERITFSGSYTMDAAEKERRLAQIEAYAETCLGGISQTATDYEKVKYIYEYLVLHTEYDKSAPDNQNICSVLIGGRSVCQGYAKATQYLLNKMGLFCTLVEGVVKGTEPHVWNIVMVDGNYYHVDTTWGDASYSITGGGESGVSVPEINYDYLCVPDSLLTRTHQINTPIPVPTCTSMEANYYVKENLYFTAYDEAKLSTIFSNAYANGAETVMIKCADEIVYQEMIQKLITQQKVFDYLKGNNNISYTKMEKQYSILFQINH